MPIRTRITGEAERTERKRKSTQLHPLLKFGSRHHSIWHTIVEAKGAGLTAAQIKARDHNFHPQILADLQKAKLVGKLSQNGSEFVYAADPAGKGVIAQEITAMIHFYETEDGKFLARAVVMGQATKHGKVVRQLGSKRINFTIPELDDPDIVDLIPVDFSKLLGIIAKGDMDDRQTTIIDHDHSPFPN